jgi:hypothetical protein
LAISKHESLKILRTSLFFLLVSTWDRILAIEAKKASIWRIIPKWS